MDTKLALNLKVDKEEIYWEQHAFANWLKNGDRNTLFCTSLRWKGKGTTGLKIYLIRMEQNRKEMIGCCHWSLAIFYTLFVTNGIDNLGEILSGVDPCISQSMNMELE